MSATPLADPNRQHLETARTQIAQGELQKAALTLNKAQQQSPNDPRVFMLAGLMAEKAGNLPKAFKALRHAVAISPDWGPGLLELALLLARQNQFDEAVSTAEKVALIEPNNLVVLAGVIDVAHRAGQLDMAVRHLRRGLELVPGDAQLRRQLARDLSGQGAHAESVELWSGLIAENPADTESLLGRVKAHLAAGTPARAVADTTTLLELAPGDSVYAYYAALAHGVTPKHQPPELNRGLFDSLAEMYDQHMVRGLRYQLPKRVADKILERFPDKKLNLLDLGCGTGLLGVCLGRLDGFLIGVDISMKMIEQAGRHNVYDRFHHVNLLDALQETPDAIYDVLAALDVFIYTGDLTETVPNALRILVPQGELIFSCETSDEAGPDMVLQPSGRYAHKRSHVVALCKAAGFETVEVEDTVLRYENNAPVQGFIVTARKAV
ncbi:tetratricopeptide repeat protein [Acidovorax sp. SUPP2522]|uniref:tetratricopeptide repeat protein n=1 Tax=unclassified Acidovorax TaxID=2684926 RepID=UPI00234B2F36|nr:MULTISPECIES: tetratricopeptide repeat protein [unclassified Acidovorax]WCM96453.1 methyltransferase domain-containing protein [Acidovorax sp. GBBC 1281]GKT15068.1 tetratricopeptide repeat protein [Acidovorax sp. SUPP2522]